VMGVGGCIDMSVLIPPGTTTRQAGAAGMLAKHISNWSSHDIADDGLQYKKSLADGVVRQYPDAGQAAAWHGPVPWAQPLAAFPTGQIDVIYAITKSGMHCGNPNCAVSVARLEIVDYSQSVWLS